MNFGRRTKTRKENRFGRNTGKSKRNIKKILSARVNMLENNLQRICK